MLSDHDLAVLTPEQRRDLMDRLQRPLDDFTRLRGGSTLRRVRRVRIGLMAVGSAVLVPWVVWLGLTLPDTYRAASWPQTWVGFDIALAAAMTATAVLGWLRRQLVLAAALVTATLLVCDAWFDVMTSAAGDRPAAVASALLAELPLAAVLVVGALRMLRLMAVRRWLLEPDESLWSLRAPLADLVPETTPTNTPPRD